MTASPYVGQRLSYSGASCTVRYVGPVSGTKGVWLGVEWDIPGRGKHSGTHQGVKYFDCQSEYSHAGSFIRSSRPVDQPVGFLNALHQKYASNTDSHVDQTPEQVIEISGKVVEEVGFEKIRRQLAALHELRIVLLDGLCVAGLNARPCSWDSQSWHQQIKRVEETCPKIVDLDLSRNLIEQWADVLGISSALGMLRSLKLNGNRFRDLSLPVLDGVHPKDIFKGVTELCLDDTLLTWDEVVTLATDFPCLNHLSASSNFLTTLSLPLSLSNLATLTLETNSITTLSSLRPLTHLNSLNTLHLRSNSISSITPPDSEPLLFHPSLQTLDLSHNAISSFSFITILASTFPGLTSLRVSNNPLYATLPIEEGYMLTLARLSTLQTLNFSKITVPERQNAEIYYLSRIAKALSATPLEQSTAILAEHPRYTELCTLYGEPAIVRKSADGATTTGKNTLGASLINFAFYLTPSTPTGRPEIKSSTAADPVPASEAVEKSKLVPRSFTTYRLKSIAGRLFALPPMHLRLILETGEWDPVGGRGEDDRWSVSSEDDDSACENEGDETRSNVQGNQEQESREKGKWVRREVELVDGTREIGFWIEGREAKVRVEWRDEVY